MSVMKVFLVVDAARRVRAVKRWSPRVDEVAIVLNLRFPDTWGHPVQMVDLVVPDFAPVVAAESDEEEGE